MRDLSDLIPDYPSGQLQAMAGRRVAPTNPFVEFKNEEIERSLPDRFEQQVRRYPDRLAVKTRCHGLTYEALNQTANRVARAIVAQRGVGEEPIALLLENDAPMIATILGVLKAGKIYVPLDPSLPRTRTSYIVEDSQARLLVTNTKNLALATDLSRETLPLLNVDELNPGLSTENLNLTISPETLAWIIYTSGSTGQPKGVMQNHRNALHFTRNSTTSFHICEHDRLTLLFSCSVHAGAYGIFAALLNGAGLYPLDIKEEGLTAMADWLQREEITIYFSVPTVFRHLVNSLAGDQQFSKLRLIYLAGEPVTKRDVELYKKHFSQDCLFVNRLGSTETDCIRLYFIDKETQIDGNLVPAGYAMEDKEILLLDDEGHEVGFNHVGEIIVKSRYVSPGYWRKPDLTRAAFVPDSEKAGMCLYHTGDLGYMLPDGCLVCLGRRDFRVKIRGYRIEIAEIEIALRNLATIKDAAVTAREALSGEAQLVAYLVPSRRPAPTVTTLRQALGATLPAYMIPSRFVFLDALPLAPNGKVDWRALPPPSGARPALGIPFVAPRTPIEETLAAIWAEVLGLDQLGIHDHFLELGGHSLLATQIVSRVRDTFHVDVPLRALLEAPTVADMAMVIAQSQVKRVGLEDITGMLAEVEALTDVQAQRLLADEITLKGER